MKLIKLLLVTTAAAILAMPAWAAPPVWEANIGPGLGQTDDDCDLVNLGFTFNYYGVPYTQVWVNSNGNMTFNGCYTQWSSPDIPEGTQVMVGPLYGDFNPAVAGDVHNNTLGVAPYRTFVATWNVVPEFAGPALDINTFQSILYEGSDLILFGYNGLSTDGINWNGPTMDVGITSGGGLFINSASGAAIPALDMTNICYVPDGIGDYTELLGECMLQVDIDIKFCSDPNAFNCRKKGVLPVTIFGTASFDVLDIDPSTLRLCEAADLLNCTNGPKDWSIADRGDPTSDLGAAMCAIDPATGEELDYLNPDQFLDLDAAFEASEVQGILGVFCSGPKNGVSPDLAIIGSTFGGIPVFSAPIGSTGIDQLVKKGKN